MGFESMRLAWGGIKWDELRLLMSIYVLIAALIALGVEMLVEKPALTAALDVLLAVIVFVLLAWTHFAAADFHPDSPVFNSGGDIIALYLTMVATTLVAVVSATALLRQRVARDEPA
jgi:NO-binding membrane sensor protein with MHYT domain